MTLDIDYVIIELNQLADTLAAIPTDLDHAIDTETNGADPHQDEVVLIQVAVPGRPVYLIPTEEMEDEHLKLLSEHFQKPFLKVFHNGKFDIKMLMGMSIQVAPPYHDTMIISRLLRCGEDAKHGLGVVVWEYLGIKLDKSLQSSFLGSVKELTPQQLLYGAIDAYVLHPLKQALQAQLTQFRTNQTIAQQEFTLLGILSHLEYQGIGVDVSQLQQCQTQHRERLTSLTKSLQHSSGASVQTKLFVVGGSQPDLYESCLSPTDTHALLQSRGISTKSGETDYLLTQSHHLLIQQILEYRWVCRQGKALESFINSCDDGTYYPDYNQIERMTGQIILQKEDAILSAMTVMGVEHPADFCFTAMPPYVLNWLSFPDLPIRVLATLSQDTALLNDLSTVRDEGSGVTYQKLIQLICSSEGNINGIDPSRAAHTGSTVQQLIQPVVEALLWAIGIGGWGAVRVQRHLYETTGLIFPKKQVQGWIDQFWQIYPQVRLYHQQIKDYSFSTNKSLLGRYRRNVKVSPDEQSIRLVMGSVSDILKLAICEVDTQLSKAQMDGRVALLLQHHIAIEVKESEESQTHFLCDHLAQRIKEVVPNLPLVVELF